MGTFKACTQLMISDHGSQDSEDDGQFGLERIGLIKYFSHRECGPSIRCFDSLKN